jgi:Domain of unknown function (DUF4340)
VVAPAQRDLIASGMKRGWLLNVVLLAAVAALGVFVWLNPSREDQAKQPLSTLQSAQAQRITLERPGQPAVTLERRDAQWQITAPLKARADEFQVLRMLTILEAQPTLQLPATDLERFDLQSPVALLTIDGAEYAFGGINTVTREQYVKRGDTVYVVALRHGAGLPANALALVRRVLLSEQEQPVAIVLPEFSLSQKEGRWTLTPPADTSQDDLQRYMDQWRHASAAQAEPYDKRPPLAEIRITLRDGAVIKFGLLQREPQLVLWRHDTGLQYLFLEAAGRALLGKPGTALADTKNNK